MAQQGGGGVGGPGGGEKNKILSWQQPQTKLIAYNNRT